MKSSFRTEDSIICYTRWPLCPALPWEMKMDRDTVIPTAPHKTVTCYQFSLSPRRTSEKKNGTEPTPQNIMDPSHRNPSSAERMCNSAPSTGVPRSKDIPTIENAIPMRVLFFRHNMSVCNISNLFESYPCSPEYELSWANSEGIKETSGYSGRWFKKTERINNGWILTHKIQTRNRITDQKKWHQQNLIRQTTRIPT